MSLFYSVILFACQPPVEENTTEQEELVFSSIADDGVSVISVEPDRYLGLWYEIASTPSSQQSNCIGTTATYSLIDSTKIKVENRCWLQSFDGPMNMIQGTASFIDDSYARLLVDFNLGFQAPYNIVELDGSISDSPYEFAAVASFGTLWILSRTPVLSSDVASELLSRLEERDYPVDSLLWTDHPEVNATP